MELDWRKRSWHARLKICTRGQCGLPGVNRAGLYYEPMGESEENLRIMRLMDERYTRAPFAADCVDGHRGGPSETEVESAGGGPQIYVSCRRLWHAAWRYRPRRIRHTS